MKIAFDSLNLVSNVLENLENREMSGNLKMGPESQGISRIERKSGKVRRCFGSVRLDTLTKAVPYFVRQSRIVLETSICYHFEK